MAQEIEKLPAETKKNGLFYKLVKKGNKAAMYSVTDPISESIVAYEVFLIKVLMNRKFKDIVYPPCEVFPGNEEFGRSAYCFGFVDAGGKENAENRYQSMEDGTFNKEVKDLALVEIDEDDADEES